MNAMIPIVPRAAGAPAAILEKARSGARLTPDDALVLALAAPLHDLCAAAMEARIARHGKNAYYVHNVHINFTNVCINACRFCFMCRHLDPVGDAKEMEAVRAVFGDQMPMISSTKSLTGHSLGAAGAQEAIYCLLMMQNGFAAESAHIETLDPAFEGMPILRQRHDGELTHVMSNSFGFGGTNGTLILSKV